MNQIPNAGLQKTLNDLINQFWAGLIQHRSHVAILQSLGYLKLSAAMQERISDEPETIAALQKRLLDLNGGLDFQSVTPTLGSDARSILALDLKVQELGLPILNAAARLAGDQSDTTTRRMIEDILVDEEEHLNWLKDEVALLERLGDQLFLAHHA
jgi:bacterioferritin